MSGFVIKRQKTLVTSPALESAVHLSDKNSIALSSKTYKEEML